MAALGQSQATDPGPAPEPGVKPGLGPERESSSSRETARGAGGIAPGSGTGHPGSRRPGSRKPRPRRSDLRRSGSGTFCSGNSGSGSVCGSGVSDSGSPGARGSEVMRSRSASASSVAPGTTGPVPVRAAGAALAHGGTIRLVEPRPARSRRRRPVLRLPVQPVLRSPAQPVLRSPVRAGRTGWRRTLAGADPGPGGPAGRTKGASDCPARPRRTDRYAAGRLLARRLGHYYHPTGYSLYP